MCILSVVVLYLLLFSDLVFLTYYYIQSSLFKLSSNSLLSRYLKSYLEINKMNDLLSKITRYKNKVIENKQPCYIYHSDFYFLGILKVTL